MVCGLAEYGRRGGPNPIPAGGGGPDEKKTCGATACHGHRLQELSALPHFSRHRTNMIKLFSLKQEKEKEASAAGSEKKVAPGLIRMQKGEPLGLWRHQCGTGNTC